MEYKKLTEILVGISVAGIIAISTAIAIIDPIDIWGSPLVYGVNQVKVKQEDLLDISRPYEFERVRPNIVYIGESEVYKGIYPTSIHASDDKVYAMGENGMSLPYIHKYLNFMYKIQKPQIVYIGINPESLGKRKFNSTRDSYSQNRMDYISSGTISMNLFRFKDNMASLSTVRPTIKYCYHHPDGEPLSLRGYWRPTGDAKTVNKKRFYYWLNGYVRNYKVWEFEPNSIKMLQQIKTEADKNGVKVVFFFAPVSADAYMLLDINGKLPAYNQAKIKAAQAVPVYDFCYINELTTNRQQYWFDILHFRKPLGEKIKAVIDRGEKPDYFKYLDSQTAVDSIEQEEQDYTTWKKNNMEYFNTVNQLVKENKKLTSKDLSKYIGF